MRNAEIAAALRELGILYELDGADRFRVLRLQGGARERSPPTAPSRSSSSRRRDRLTELPGFGKTLAEKVEALIETGEIPAADKLKEKFPRLAGRGDAGPGARARRRRGASSTSSASGPRGAARGGRAGADPGDEGPRDQGRGERAGGAREPAGRGRRVRAPAALQGAAGRARSWRPRSRPCPPSGRVEVAGSARRWAETCKDIDLVATSEDPAALGAGARRARAGRAGRLRPATGGTSVLTHAGLKVDVRITPRGDVREPAAALHGLGRAQRRSFASAR